MVGRSNRTRHRVRKRRRPPHRNRRCLHWRLAFSTTRPPSWLEPHLGGYQRHHRRGVTVAGYQARSRRRRMGEKLERELGKTLVADSWRMPSLTPRSLCPNNNKKDYPNDRQKNIDIQLSGTLHTQQ